MAMDDKSEAGGEMDLPAIPLHHLASKFYAESSSQRIIFYVVGFAT